jgi:hypothetical protein
MVHRTALSVFLAHAGRAESRDAASTAVDQSPPCQLLIAKGGDSLAVTLSLLAILAVVVFVLCRYAGLRVWHALVCVLLGFYLASSSLAPDINRIVESIIHAL